MYAVIRTGGKQYRVQPGDLLVVEKLDGEPGANVAFGDVLMLGEGEAVTIGAPLVEGARVQATLIETRKGGKIKIFKKIRRQGYRRTKGHRQLQSVLRVTAIAGAGQEAKWDGEVTLTTKAELNARSRGLAYQAPQAAAAAVETAPAPKKAAAPKPAKTAEEVLASDEVKQAMETAETNAPVAAAPKAKAPAKTPAAKAAPAPAKAGKAKAGSAKPAAKPASPKAAQAKAEPSKPEAKKAAPRKAAAPKKDKGPAR